MNALANSQAGELEKFLRQGYPDGRGPVSFARYTGQESDEERQAIIGKPPDILLTNYVMLELLLTRPYEKRLIDAAKGIRFLILDEMHTYRGRQGADVALLVRRVRDRLEAEALQSVGTSATLAGKGTFEEQRQEVARVASLLFGAEVRPGDVIGETLRRATPPRRLDDPAFVADLRERLQDAARKPPSAYHAFTADPLSTWIESTLGITAEAGSDRLVRSKPRPVSGRDGCATDLNRLTGVDTERCIAAIHEGLLAGYRCENPDTGFPAFAFRLHQFISPGQSVYASLGDEAERHITVQGQQFVPGDRSRVLLPLVFCFSAREKGPTCARQKGPRRGTRSGSGAE